MGLKEKTAIPSGVRRKVIARDSQYDSPCCIYCGDHSSLQIHHVVPRSLGGMGILTNLVLLCAVCHGRVDNESSAEQQFCIEYLKDLYPGWSRQAQIYTKE